MTSGELYLILCDKPNGNGTLCLVLAWVFTSLGIIAVSLRVISKKVLNKRLGWDDCLSIGALATGFVTAVFVVEEVQAGLGRHIQCLSFEDIGTLRKWSTLSEITITICLGLVKRSICIFTQKAIRKSSQSFMLLLRVLLCVSITAHTANTFLCIFQCRPLPAFWDPDIAGICYSLHTTYIVTYVNIALDTFTDLACAALPMYFIYKVQIPLCTKLAISALIGLGVFTAGSAIGIALTLNGFFVEDWTWEITSVSVLTCLELGLAITVPSLPAIRTLYIHIKRQKLKAKQPVERSSQLLGNPSHSTDIFQVESGSERDITSFNSDLELADTHHRAVQTAAE